MKKTGLFTTLYLTISIFIISCSSQSGEITKDESATVAEQVKAVNMYNYSKNGLQVLKDVTNPKSHLTFIQLGEVVTLLGETDSLNNREYAKVQLSDGNIGWSMSNYLIANAKPAAIIEETNLYERPNVINKTSKTLNNIDIVAITDESDGWLQVTGINTIKKGWISKDAVSQKEEDVAMAVLAIKAVFDVKGKLLTDKIEEFLKSAPYPQSTICRTLQAELDAQTSDDIYIEESEDAGMNAESETEATGETK